jgi:CheY-like chemotaxis protein
VPEQAGKARRLPILAVTAHSRSEEREICFAAGMDDFLSKPINIDVLSTALEKWLPPKNG